MSASVKFSSAICCSTGTIPVSDMNLFIRTLKYLVLEDNGNEYKDAANLKKHDLLQHSVMGQFLSTLRRDSD
jgi:hypothetical protein